MVHGTSRECFVSGIVATFLLLTAAISAFADELAGISAAITARGAKWTAGETAVSKLPPQQRKALLGLIMPSASRPERVLSLGAEHLKKVRAYASYDWRTYGYVTPVRNQGTCGSCWAFATTGALESFVLRTNNWNYDVDRAEQVLISCGQAGSCAGGDIDKASDFIHTAGLPEEGCYRYITADGSCTDACSNWQSSTYGTTSWSRLAPFPTGETLKAALLAYGPLVATMRVYGDFYFYKRGIYSYTTGTYQGDHAILIVGYDDSYKCFIVKNSWGTDWGELGYFRISYSELSDVVCFGCETIAYHECTYSILPGGASFSWKGGSGSIDVATSQPTCRWVATSDSPWVTITSGREGTGAGTVTYRVSKEKRSESRRGFITAAGQVFEVTQ